MTISRQGYMTASNKGGFQWENWSLKTGYKPVQYRLTVTAPICPACDKTVYPAEEVMGAGQRFHKFCLRCTSCTTLLNTGNLNEHKKKVYCASCYRREFGQRGVNHGLPTISSLHVDTPPNSPHFNQMKTKLQGRKTSTGSSVSRTSSDEDSRSSNPYVHKITYINGVPLQQMNIRSPPRNTPAFKIISMPRNTCPRCSKTVYLAEEIKAIGKSFHKRCCICANCNGSISGGRYSEHNGELYDNNCYQRLFGPKGTLFSSN